MSSSILRDDLDRFKEEAVMEETWQANRIFDGKEWVTEMESEVRKLAMNGIKASGRNWNEECEYPQYHSRNFFITSGKFLNTISTEEKCMLLRMTRYTLVWSTLVGTKLILVRDLPKWEIRVSFSENCRIRFTVEVARRRSLSWDLYLHFSLQLILDIFTRNFWEKILFIARK